MTERVRFEQRIPVPLDRVWRFFSDPANLPRLMPPELAAEIRSIAPAPPSADGAVHDASARVGAGTEITLSVRLLPPLPLRTAWVARIVEFEPGRHFTDVQVKGPFRHWRHRHGFEAAPLDGADGTIVQDDLEYDVGFGALGDALARWFVGARIRQTFEERQRRLEHLLRGP
ncbi:MAG TPA: SRPBCC family protein [Anaeromyxobacteraceae bacterium]|nr:SRPBCC family protein [Anaeromyxobacteraceae bacterium]